VAGTSGGSGGFRRGVEVFTADSIDQSLVSGAVIRRDWIGIGDEGEATVLFGVLQTLFWWWVSMRNEGVGASEFREWFGLAWRDRCYGLCAVTGAHGGALGFWILDFH